MGMVQRLFRRVSDRSRQRKLELFFSIFRPGPGSRVLDLGGEASHADQPSKQLLDLYPHREQLVVINNDYPVVRTAVQLLPGLRAVCGDGLRMPFADKSFDVCYCNAVIEHLTTRANQERFASEIMRVARSWFITTPNRWFPFEPHMRLPLVTWLPRRWQQVIGYTCGYNHLKHRYAFGCDRRDLRLLSGREFAQLFPGSRLIPNGMALLPPTYILVGGELPQETVPAPSAPEACGAGAGRA